MRRIAIIGSSGSGKSTLGRQLSDLLHVDLIHFDRLCWKPDWVPTSNAEREQQLNRYLQKESWIIEGDGDRSNPNLIYDRRFAHADTIVWLDFPRHTCFWQIVQKYLNDSGDRQDLPAGCQPNIFHKGFLNFLKQLWNYPQRDRQIVGEKIQRYWPEKRVFILRRPTEVKDFIHAIARVNFLSTSAVSPKVSKTKPTISKLISIPATS